MSSFVRLLLCLLLGLGCGASVRGVELVSVPTLEPTRCSSSGLVVVNNPNAQRLEVSAVTKRSGAAVQVPGFLDEANPRFLVTVPRELPPGRTELAVVFSAPSDGSDDDFLLGLELVAGGRPLAFELHGQRGSAALMPLERVDLGVTPVGGSLTRTLTLPPGATASFPADAGALTVSQNQIRFAPTSEGTSVGRLELRRDCELASSLVVATAVPSILALLPATLDFGYVPLSLSRTKRLTVFNHGFEPVSVTPTTALPFEVLDAGVVLLPAATRSADESVQPSRAQLSVRFTPTTTGRATNRLVLATTLASQPLLDVPLSGSEGGPDIEVLPAMLTLSPTPASARITVRNVGSRLTDPASNLHLGVDGVQPFTELVHVSGLTGNVMVMMSGYDVRLGLPPSAGQTIELIITATAGPSVHDLHIFSDDVDEPVVTVRIVVN